MEEDLMDELYGDLDDHPSGMPQDEDSVDIYSGLENSPNGNGNKRKVNHLLSPCTIKSMDMYEDILREEGEKKEATYNELKQKFEAAQIQVKELLSKLQLQQTKNSSLNNENILLKKNICSLIKTARMEIVRKDEEITRLSNRSGRGSYGQKFRQPQTEGGQVNRRHSFNNASCSVLEYRDCKQDNITNEVNKHKGNSALGQATESAVMLQPFEVLQRCHRNDLEHPLSRQNKNCVAGSDSGSIQPEQEYVHVHHNRTSMSVKYGTTSKVADVSGSKTCNAGLTTSKSDIGSLEDKNNCLLKQVDVLEEPQAHTSLEKECILQDKNVSQKSQRRAEDNSCKSGRNERELVKENSMSRETTNHLPQAPVILKSSQRPKSPSFQSNKSLPSKVCSQSSKSSVKTAADLETKQHNQDTDRSSKGTRPTGWRSTTCSVVDEVSHFQNNKIEKGDPSGQQRKDEKLQGTTCGGERWSTRTERHKEHEQKRARESGRSKRDESYSRSKERSSNRPERSKEYEQRNSKQADNKDDQRHREGKTCKQIDALDNKQAFSSKCDSQGKNAGKVKASDRIDELNSKKSHSYANSRRIKGFHSPYKNAGSDKHCARGKDKHKDRERKRGSRCEEHIVQKDRKSKNVALNKDDQRDFISKKHRNIGEGQQCENHQNKHLQSVHTELLSSAAVSSNLCKTKDNSPDRKLSFMETLNLTLSPLKKQRSSSDLQEPVAETYEDTSADDTGISELAEEFFVIDELQNSQQSAEETNGDPEPTTADKEHDRTRSGKQSEQGSDLLTVVTSKSSTEETDMQVQKENVIEVQEAVEELPAVTTPEKKICKTSDLDALQKDSSSKLNLASDSQTNIYQDCTKDSLEMKDNLVVSNSLPTKTLELMVVSDNTSDLIVNGCQNQDPFTTLSEETSKIRIQNNPKPESQDLLPAQNGICQENVSFEKACSIFKSNSPGNSERSVSMEVSSSTNIDFDEQGKAEVSTSQGKERATHAFEILKPVEMSQITGNLKMAEKFHQSLLWGQNSVPKDSTTVREETMSSVQASFSEPDSTEKDEQNLNSLSSDVVCHDEDSMMLTLRNIRVIPEAISPLTSPVRPVKKVQPYHSDKQPHVKSLSKDLSAATSDKVNLDMNKENKSPDTSVTSASQKRTIDSLSVSETEEEDLEDGEIVSESEEEGPLFIQTPPREKDKSISGTCTNQKLSSVGKRVPPKKSCIPVKYSNQSKNTVTTAPDCSPTSSKRRFKTVSLPLKAAICTSDEFMDMLSSIRVELRRKYMKLHKNVTKTAFCCIVDMSQASFTEFVNSVNLDKLCNKDNNIKVKLNKIICSIMSKVTKNGIVNRIFDQKAGDLKQKLWTFMDGQINFLFKELKAALKSAFESPMNACSAENKNTALRGKEIENEAVEKEPIRTSVHKPKKAKVDTGNCAKEALPHNLPPRGLGSRGKNIKAVMKEDDEQTEVNTSLLVIPTSSSEKSVHGSTSGSENKVSSYVRRLSSNGSIQDKSDFEILTEQQASSLTFNLVSDAQMGEIFKCLLQGSDLLEHSLPVGDNQCWPVTTPRKEGLPGESLIGIITPNKTTPSKFITSLSSISPYKFASNSKILDPAILDESCLLEVPSSSEPCQVSGQSAVTSQRTFSILAEDLAVSLTIPSPLKSDSHLSFLHPETGQPLSAHRSIFSAHYNEDALTGEDATEQDIHLSLDTDNSSCGSSPSRTCEDSDPSGFQFKPNLPMQAVVMERSNDHFIVRIRHASTGLIESNQYEDQAEPALAAAEPALAAAEPALAAAEQDQSLDPNLTTSSKDLGPASAEILDKSLARITKLCHTLDQGIDAQPQSQRSPSKNVCEINSFSISSNKDGQVSKDANVTHLEKTSAEIKTAVKRVSRKRKEHHLESKAKRCKIEKSQDKHHKSRHDRRSKSPKEKSCKAELSQVSPSNLSAKNVIRKKGEVVVTWTRDEDRDILVELKMKGASPKTFAALSKRLKKSTEQIEERFTQLLKLFKKKEKMEN